MHETFGYIWQVDGCLAQVCADVLEYTVGEKEEYEIALEEERRRKVFGGRTYVAKEIKPQEVTNPPQPHTLNPKP